MPTRRSLRHEFQSCAALPFKVQHSSLIRSQIASLLSGLGLTKSAGPSPSLWLPRATESPVGPNGWLRVSMAVVRSRRTCSLARPAILTVLRAWHMAGTTIGVNPMGSFEECGPTPSGSRCSNSTAMTPATASQQYVKTTPAVTRLAVLLEWKRALGIETRIQCCKSSPVPLRIWTSSPRSWGRCKSRRQSNRQHTRIAGCIRSRDMSRVGDY
jgi:hypothetical protein